MYFILTKVTWDFSYHEFVQGWLKLYWCDCSFTWRHTNILLIPRLYLLITCMLSTWCTDRQRTCPSQWCAGELWRWSATKWWVFPTAGWGCRELPPCGAPWVSGLVGHCVQTWPDSECSHTLQYLDCSDLNWHCNHYHLFWHGMTLLVLMCR